jgi:ABC-type Na+ efflux pump permease subunit
VLKDILLVAASMVIWGTQVTPLQMFGYSIALGGLVHYKLGADKIKEYLGHSTRIWSDYGVKHPAVRRLVVLAAALLGVVFMFGAVVSRYAPQYESASKYLTSLLTDKAA